jgi:hypothetical protein
MAENTHSWLKRNQGKPLAQNLIIFSRSVVIKN